MHSGRPETSTTMPLAQCPVVRDRVDCADLHRVDADIFANHVEQRVDAELGKDNLLTPYRPAGRPVRVDEFSVILDGRYLVGEIEEGPEVVDVEGSDARNGAAFKDVFRRRAP